MAIDIASAPVISSPDHYVAIKDGRLVTVTSVDAAGAIDSMNDVPGLTDALSALSNSVSAVIGAAPGDLNTIEKVAAAVNNDPDFYATVPPFSQGVDGDNLAAVHSDDGSHTISQVAGLTDAIAAAGAPAATDLEITTGTATATRTVTPAQVKLAVNTFAPAETIATNTDITTGTSTTPMTVSPAQIKLSAQTFTPVPTAATDLEITTGTATATRTVSPAQIKTAVTTFAPGLAPVQSVANRTGPITLTLDDAADSSASSGRLAITTAEAAKLRSVAAGSIAGRKAADGTGALTILTAAEAVAELPVATAGAKGLLPSGDKAKIDGLIPINEVLIGTFTTGNTVLTLTDMPAAVKNPASTAIIPLEVSLHGVTKIKLRGKISTAGATGARVAVKFCVNTTSSSWIMSNGDTEPANSSSAPDSTTATNWDAWLIDSTASAIIDQEVDVPSACQSVTGLCRLWLVLWGGDGTTDPVLANLRVYIPTGATIGVASATDGEIAAGTVTDTRTVSPKQIKDSVLAFAPAGVAAATDLEITTGTATATRTVTPAQVKLAVNTFAPAETIATNTDITTGTSTTPMTVSPAQIKLSAETFTPVPTAASDGEITTGTSTATRTVSPKQIKDAVTTFAPGAANMATSTIKGRVTAGTGAPEDLTVIQAQTLLALPPDTATRLAFTTYNGIVDPSLQTLSYDATTRTFTVTKVSDYDVWVGGSKITITATKTVVHASSSTTFYIYFDASGTLIASTTKWSYYGSNAPVAILAFSVFGIVGIWADCRFPYRRSYTDWEYQDGQVGAWLDYGYDPSFGAIDGSVSVAAGRHVLNGRAYSTGSATTVANVIRRRTDLSWNQNTTDGSDIRLVVSSILNYDNNGSQANVTLNYYANAWLFMLGTTLFSVAGQAQYSTLAGAEAETVDGVSLPAPIAAAGRLIARVTYQRTTATPTGAYTSWGDYRRSRIINGVTIGGGGGSGSSGGGSAGGVPTTRAFTAGAGLIGGGDLSADRSFALDPAYLATISSSGLMSPGDKARLDLFFPAIDYLYHVFCDGSTLNTFTSQASTFANPGIDKSYRVIDLTNITSITLSGYVSTAGASTSRVAIAFNTALKPTYATNWYFADGTVCPANGGTAPTDSAAYGAGKMGAVGPLLDISGAAPVSVPISPALLALAAANDYQMTMVIVRWGGNGTASPVVNMVSAYIPVAQPASGNIVEFAKDFIGTPAANATIGYHIVTTDMYFPAQMTSSKAYVGTPPTTTIIVNIKKNGTTFASITFSAGSNAGVFSGSQTTFAPGDLVTLVMPGVNGSIANLAWALAGIPV